jgi:L-aspartate oxidase
MKYSKQTAVIVGGGIAGLYVALKLEQRGKNVLLVTKSELGESNSKYAQGGMVAVLKSNKLDTTQSHIDDTLNAGAGLSEVNTVKFISENSDDVVKDLLNFGVDFDRDEKGEFTLTKEAAHSVRRILHSGGDATGRHMENSLCLAVKNNKNIKICENTIAVDLLVKDNKCEGVILFDGKEYQTVFSNIVILATGGLGQLYKYTTNPKGATGDGFALAYRSGATLQDMEFVQFHPTALAFDDEENRFLISEAVRGEGAKLCDKSGKEFMSKYHEKLELAPRDIVARANFCEMRDNKTSCVYLNATGLGEEKLARRFPTIGKKCLEHGIDITKDFIPVAPAAHYFMGGIKVDTMGKTSIENLYAIGEVSSTGLHGANRLASNSLLECVVCAFALGTQANLGVNNIELSELKTKFQSEICQYEENQKSSNIDVKSLKSKIQEIMWNGVGIFRSEESLTNAKMSIEKLSEQIEDSIYQTKEGYELRNMFIVAKLIINSALNRKESRGAHYRTDYLNTSEKIEHSLISKNKGECFAK